MPNDRRYIEAQDKYNPKEIGLKIRLLLVGESPPANDGFFYFEDDDLGGLCRETMTALGLLRAGDESRIADRTHLKKTLLSSFQKLGFFLVDTSYIPVNRLTTDERESIIRQNLPILRNEVKSLEPENIIIIMSRLFRFSPLREVLLQEGLADKLLNDGPLPFPSRKKERIQRYHETLRRWVTDAGLLNE